MHFRPTSRSGQIDEFNLRQALCPWLLSPVAHVQDGAAALQTANAGEVDLTAKPLSGVELAKRNDAAVRECPVRRPEDAGSAAVDVDCRRPVGIADQRSLNNIALPFKGASLRGQADALVAVQAVGA